MNVHSLNVCWLSKNPIRTNVARDGARDVAVPGRNGQVKLYDEHMKVDCPRRKVMCGHNNCEELVPLDRLEDHEERTCKACVFEFPLPWGAGGACSMLLMWSCSSSLTAGAGGRSYAQRHLTHNHVCPPPLYFLKMVKVMLNRNFIAGDAKQLIICPLGCKKYVALKSLSRHKKIQCVNRFVV